MVTFGQVYQHFLSSLSINILAPKKLQSETVIREKMMMKLTP